MADSLLSSPATWAAIAAGVGGIAYAVMNPSESEPKARAQARVRTGSGSVGPGSANEGAGTRPGKSKKSKKSKESKKPAGPPSPYAEFVRAQMPALLKKGYSSPEAMKVIGKLWQARK